MWACRQMRPLGPGRKGSLKDWQGPPKGCIDPPSQELVPHADQQQGFPMVCVSVCRAGATLGLSRGRGQGHGRRSAPQSGEVGDGGIESDL